METEQHAETLLKAGLKITHPRIKIFQLFEAEEQIHLSADDVYKKLLGHKGAISLATVYRVLTQFEAAGILVKHHFEHGKAVYELDRGEHHDHMVDVVSGKVIEFVSEEIEKLQQQIAAMHGYEIENHSMVLYVYPKKST